MEVTFNLHSTILLKGEQKHFPHVTIDLGDTPNTWGYEVTGQFFDGVISKKKQKFV